MGRCERLARARRKPLQESGDDDGDDEQDVHPNKRGHEMRGESSMSVATIARTTAVRPHVIASKLLQQYGFSVIPVHKQSKLPTIAWKVFQHRHPTHAEMAAWFDAETNVGIITGSISGVVVVDCDDDAAVAWAQQHLPITPMTVRTGGGGLHLYFRHPGRPVRNKVRARGLKLDLRADGGFVVAPGSVHAATGHRYVAPVKWPTNPDVVPVFDPTWLAEPPRPAPPPRIVPVMSAPLALRVQRYIERVPPAVEGQGGDAHTYKLACRLVRGFGLDDAEALAALWAWNQTCDPPWSEHELLTKIRNARAYGDEQMGGRR